MVNRQDAPKDKSGGATANVGISSTTTITMSVTRSLIVRNLNSMDTIALNLHGIARKAVAAAIVTVGPINFVTVRAIV